MTQATISFDLDDTLNWMSKELAKEAGLDYIPNYDDAKAGIIPESYIEARKRCFPIADFWAKSPKTENADHMINMTKAMGFKPIICTKIPRSEKGFNIPAGAKVQWQQENFPDIDMLMVAGQKHSDSRALIDDSMKNCRLFNQEQKWYRPALKWDNARPSLPALLSVLRMARDYAVPLVKTPAALIVVRAKDTGDILAFERSDGHLGLPCGSMEANETPLVTAIRELQEETGVEVDDATFIMTLVNNERPVHCFFTEIDTVVPVIGSSEGIPQWQDPTVFIKNNKFKYIDFNRVLLYNLGLIS